MLLSQAYCGSVVSVRSAGSSSHSRASLVIAGASNSTDAAEVSAVPEVLLGHHLAQHAEQLHPQLVDRGEPVGRVRGAGLGDQPVERVVLRRTPGSPPTGGRLATYLVW